MSFTWSVILFVRIFFLLGILLLGVNWPIWAGSTSSVAPKVIKPKKADEGLRPVAGSRLVAVNRNLYIDLYCKIGIRRGQPGYVYRPELGLCELTGVTHVYKGMTRRWFKDNRQQTRDIGEACLLPSHRNPINSITTRCRLLPSSKGPN